MRVRWYERMNGAMDYIEANLAHELSYDRAAQIACCSTYHFQRMFSFITEVTLSEYIRKRRMSRAAEELMNTDIKIVDLAMKYDYESPEAFTRAFREIHGVSPRDARKYGLPLKAFPRITFLLSVKGDTAMDYRIETKEAFDIFGIETVCSLTGAEGFISPSELWQKCHKDGEYERLATNAGKRPSFMPQGLCKVHAAEYYRTTEENTFPYMLCAFVSKTSKTDGYKVVHIPAQTYVVFSSEKFKWDHEFFKILTTMQKRFYSEWLPTAKYERADGANFEIYGGTEEYGYIELWYPIVSK